LQPFDWQKSEISSKRHLFQKVFCILWASQATNPKMVKTTFVALDELYDMGIDIRGLGNIFPF
jgi:hypothetical protein